MNTYNIHINLPPEAVSLATAPVSVGAPDLALVAELAAHRKVLDVVARTAGLDGYDPAQSGDIEIKALADHVKYMADVMADQRQQIAGLEPILNEVAMAVGHTGDDNALIPGMVVDRITAALGLEAEVSRLTADLAEADVEVATLRSLRAELTGERDEAYKRINALEAEVARLAASLPVAGLTPAPIFKAGDLVTVTWPDGVTTAPGVVRADDPETGRFHINYYDMPPSGGSGETWAEPERLAHRSGDEPGDPVPAPAEKPKRTRKPKAPAEATPAETKTDAPDDLKWDDAIGWPAGVTRADYLAWKTQQEAYGVTENVNPLEYKRLKDAGLIVAPKPAPSAPAPTAELLLPGTRVTYEANPAAGIYQAGTGSIVSPAPFHGAAGYIVERDQGGRSVMAAVAVKEVAAEDLPEPEPTPSDAPAEVQQVTRLAEAFAQLPKAELVPGAKVLAFLTRGEVAMATVETVWDDGLRVQLKTADGREFVEGDRIRARRVIYVAPNRDRLPAAITGVERLESGRVDLVFEGSGNEALGVPVDDLWPAPAAVEPDGQFSDEKADENPFVGSEF